MTEIPRSAETIFPRIVLTRRSLLKAAGIVALAASGIVAADRLFSPSQPSPTPSSKAKREVLGFLRGTQVNQFISSVDSLDLSIITSLAHFALPLDGNNGDLLKRSGEYQAFAKPQDKLAQIIRKSQEKKVRQLLTITLFDQDNQAHVANFLNRKNGAVRRKAIAQITEEVFSPYVRYSGVSLDFEPAGNMGQQYRYRFTDWVNQLSEALKTKDKTAYLNVCVNPQAVRESMVWDLKDLSQVADIAMMAYDFQPSNSDNPFIMPTAPLYGYKEGEYWFDVSTAVEQFLEFIPADKLILIAPLYGLRAKVSKPAMKAKVLDQLSPYTYAQAQRFVRENQGKANFITEWSDYGRTEWYALQESKDRWEIVVVGGPKMLQEWYQFIKGKGLKGVGFWALDQATLDRDFWKLLSQELG